MFCIIFTAWKKFIEKILIRKFLKYIFLIIENSLKNKFNLHLHTWCNFFNNHSNHISSEANIPQKLYICHEIFCYQAYIF